ncbi:hypothetical protein [Microvirga sp. VF16]|uniref:hypothetical protein n=1 Tax=Microvirga sp. VF16 TaxID=2807101 RepID=UPI00193CDF0A|nr:hypothetical protein [Microvirga sp. VF16]QRM32770.1 hypothetical protein JO965_25660 [Microvirga sp. VF16]
MSFKPQSFAGRVRYAADLIASGARPCRAFDSCFENYDGDAIAAALIREAATNRDLAQNLGRYINRARAQEATDRRQHLSDEALKREAERLRREGRTEASTAPPRNVQLALL